PGGEFGVGGAQLAVGDQGQPGDFLGNVDTVGLRHTPELLDLAFQFGDRLFEVEVVAHRARALAQFPQPKRPGPPYLATTYDRRGPGSGKKKLTGTSKYLLNRSRWSGGTCTTPVS